jgi:hypothetical protein
MRTRRKKVKEDEQRTYGEVRQWLIDKYRVDHFDSILTLEKVLEESQKLLKDSEKPTHQKRLENLIKRTEKDLLKLRNKTPEILNEADRMQKELDSLK